ncbi:MAG TPA: FtsX-like permease family protein [Chryseosolibacter sp.]|nr:FtsX-like permease family protein [Chryseosolibacter sp.]
MIAAIAWRNVWRNRWRSIVILMAITAGLTGGILTVAIYTGLSDQKVRAAINVETAHLQIHAPGFLDNKDLKLAIANPDKMVSIIASENGVQSISPRLVATAMAASANANSGVQLNGIVPEKERAVSTLYHFVTQGEYFPPGKRNQILISQRTAEKLKVALHGKVIVTLQDVNGDIVGAAFRVSGIFRTTHSMFDEANVFVRKADLERILSMAGAVNEIAIRVRDIDQVEEVQGSLQAKIPADHADIASWRQIQPELAYITDVTWQVNYLILIIILLALAFGILNTMLMAIFERVKEIGVLMAVGMSKARIFIMIIMETVFLSLTGAVLGMAISAWVVSVAGTKGINLGIFAQGLEAYGYSSVIYPQLAPVFYVTLAFMVIMAALLSSLYPAYKALTLNPVEAIHG